MTTIALHTQPIGGFGVPSINATGTVAFFATENNLAVQRIVSGNGGPHTTIADIAGPFRDFYAGDTTAINASGTVAFAASLDAGGSGIFVSNGGVVTPLLINSVSSISVGSFSFNDSGTLAFRTYFGQAANSYGIVTYNAGLVTTIVTDSGPLNYFGSTPSLNGDGTVAFVAGVDGIDGGVFGIYTGNGGPLTTIADLAGPFSYLGDFSFYQPSINASGEVAFSGALDAGGGGVFIGDGTTTNEVIQAGDPLFGSIVKSAGVSPHSLNDSGQVAFYYELANGTTGIAIANPVPEPSPALLLALSLGFSLAIRKTPRRGMKRE